VTFGRPGYPLLDPPDLVGPADGAVAPAVGCAPVVVTADVARLRTYLRLPLSN